MYNNLKKSLLVAAIGSLFVASAAHATNGYFAHGYGTKNKALAGGGAALPQDAMIAATNPAGMVWVGDRMDLGAAIFSPLREYTVSGSPPNAGAPTFDLQLGNVESDSNIFLVPHFARNWMMDSKNSLGVSVYGNGGMNTDYPLVPAVAAPPGTPGGTYYGGASAGIDLAQLFINFSSAIKLNDNSSFGASMIFAYQRFKAEGLAAFGPFSSAPANLTDIGYDDATGFGAKFGWQGDVTPEMSLAISYQTKINMSKFDKYAGLFAEQGGFDIPASWTVGLAYDIASAGTATFDVQSIMFSDINAVGNGFLPNIFDPAGLGSSGGAGFGFEDIMIYKFGYQWPGNSDMTWRVGFSVNEQPIPNSEVLFNILAPAVIEQHLTGGFTKKMAANSELTFSVMYAPSASVTGDNPLSGSPGDGNVTAPLDQKIELEMSQWEFEASWAWKY